MANPQSNFPDFNYSEFQKQLTSAKNDSDLFEVIVNAPFAFKVQTVLLYMGIIVLLLVNKKTQTIDRVAISNTELAISSDQMSLKRLNDIKIPLDHPRNIIAKAIRTNQPQHTSDWKYLYMPDLSAKEARLNQAGGAIAYSAVYPLAGVRDGGALIFDYHQYEQDIGKSQQQFMEAYSQLVADRLKSKS